MKTVSETFGACLRFGAILGLASTVTFSGTAFAETMKSAVNAAVTSNPTGQAGRADVRASALELLQLEEDYKPRLSLTARAGAEYFDDTARLTPADNRETRFAREIGVTGEVVLFDGHRRANRVYRNSARVDESIFGLLDASETIALNAVEAYIDVIRHHDLMHVADHNIRKHRQIARQVRELVDAGRLSSSDQFEIDERLMAARLAKLDIQQSLADAKARYEAVIGHKPKGNMAVPHVPHLPANKRELIITAVRENFRVREADTRVRQKEYQEGIDTADELPQVSFRAGLRHGSDLDGLGGDESDAFAGVYLNWDFYAGGRKARRSALRHRTAEETARRAQTVREIQELAARSWNAYTTNIERAVLLQRQLSAARKAADQYEKQFVGGTRSLLDVLDAEQTYFNVRFEGISAEASLSFSQFRMLAAQSRLAGFFGARPADVPLIPNYEKRARQGKPTAIFNTEIRALE